MRVRPQSLYHSDSGDASSPYTEDRTVPVARDARPPVVALLDGYPVENHALLRNRLRIDEVDVRGVDVPVARRKHGTAMASLIVHGDLGDTTVPIERTVQVIPILGAPQNLAEECTPPDKLPLGLVHRAVIAMMEGVDGAPAIADNVVIVNHSICDREGPFNQRPSYWAKLLDYHCEQIYLYLPLFRYTVF